MTLSLDALANWEAAVLARIAVAKGTPDERDAQITRSGLYAEYPAIVASYMEIAGSESDDRLEALKRALFLTWHSFTVLPVDSGISEIAESTIRHVFDAVDRAIARGDVDDEFRCMVAWYHGRFPEPFDYFGPVAALTPFIGDLSTADAIGSLHQSHFGGRGQLGSYWTSVLGS